MNLKEQWRQDDAVSPVIGVILMVAITVIMAAVVGGFLLNVDNNEPAPQSTWETKEITDNNGNAVAVEITHTGGSTIDAEQVDVAYSGDFDYGNEVDFDTSTFEGGNITVLYPSNSEPTTKNVSGGVGIQKGETAADADPIQAGDTVTICFVKNTNVNLIPPRDIEDADATGENLRVFWTEEGSSNSKTLGVHEMSNPIKGDFSAADEHCNYDP